MARQLHRSPEVKGLKLDLDWAKPGKPRAPATGPPSAGGGGGGYHLPLYPGLALDAPLPQLPAAMEQRPHATMACVPPPATQLPFSRAPTAAPGAAAAGSATAAAPPPAGGRGGNNRRRGEEVALRGRRSQSFAAAAAAPEHCGHASLLVSGTLAYRMREAIRALSARALSTQPGDGRGDRGQHV